MLTTHFTWLGLLCLMVVAAAICPLAAAQEVREPVVRKVIDVAPVWSGHPVTFCLATRGDRQFVAFYDADRQMTVASRRLDSDQWQFGRVDEHVGWDSHNSINMAIDDNGDIHLLGNMHCVPLIYFRTQKPLDVTSFQRLEHMVGDQENQCTYPNFMRGPGGELIFHYRYGKYHSDHTGNGNEVYNVYDAQTRKWRRLMDQSLTDGEQVRHAYFDGPLQGPDGYYHLVWVWRESADAATNHDLSYARSRDLQHWENSRGEPMQLPISLAGSDVVDPTPVHGGMINGNNHVGFDSQKNVVISYHKYDADGNTQIYCARLRDGAWEFHQVTDWDVRWDFGGFGTLQFQVRLGRGTWEDGVGFVLPFSHFKYGSGRLVLDDKTFKIIDTLPALRDLPASELKVKTVGFPDMQVNVRSDSGRGDDPNVRYLLRWETLSSNRDQPREGPLPEPTMLQVYEVESAAGP